MLGLVSTLLTNPLLFVVVAVALLLSITVHECSHAYVAWKLGDPTAKNLGRVSLNPLAHLDPIGTLVLLFVGFGWGKAVPINYYNLKNPKRDAALISLAGPASNLIMATCFTVFVKLANAVSWSIFFDLASTFIYPIILYNVVLGIFNLIPLEPLDGFKIVNGILPPRLAVQWVQLAPYGIYVLILLAITGTVSKIIYPVIQATISILGI